MEYIVLSSQVAEEIRSTFLAFQIMQNGTYEGHETVELMWELNQGTQSQRTNHLKPRYSRHFLPERVQFFM